MNSFGDDDEDPFGEEPEWALDSLDDDDDDNDNDNTAAGTTKPVLYGAEHVLILLDCNPSMFERYIERDHGDKTQCQSPMELSLTAISKLLRLRIRTVAESKTGKRNGVGVLLFGCDTLRAVRDESGDEDYDDRILPSTHQLVDLRPPGIEEVLGMQSCLGKRDLEKEFSCGYREEKIEGEEDNDGAHLLKNALHEANKVFMHAKCVKSETPSNKLPDSKILWIFTNIDDPCNGNEADARQVAAIAKDATENGININLLPLPPRNRDFDKTMFYDEIISSKDEFTQDDAVDIEAVLDSFNQAIRKVRKYAVLPLLLPGWKERGGDSGIMLDLYSKMQTKTKPQSVTVHQELNKATVRNLRIIERDTGTEVAPSRLHTYAEFCGGQVTIKKVDIRVMKALCNSNPSPSLILFGFKKMHTLSSINFIGKPLLAFGNDELVRGSRKALFNLKQSMLKKGVYAVGEFVVRKTSPSRMVAFVPQQDSLGGFQIIPLPFKEEVRSVAPPDIGEAEQDVVDAANAMVSKLIVKTEEQFVSILHDNPYLDYFFNFLESVSLGGKLIKPEDDACMNEAVMHHNASTEMESFELSLPKDEVVQSDRKRKQPIKSSTSKKYNVNVPSIPIEDRLPRKWIEMYRNDEIADCTANELKEFLRSIGERITGKKSDLVDRIHRYIQKQLLVRK